MKDLDIVKKLDVKKLLMAVAMTAFIVNSAQAAEPKASVSLPGNVITVGDVFDGVTHDADHVLAPAPAYGDTMTLNAYDLKRISDAFNLGWFPQTNAEEVVIRRDAHEVDHYAIEAALKKGLTEQLNGQKFELQLNDPSLSFHLPESSATDLDVSNLKIDLAKGEFHALVSAPRGAARPVIKQDVAGKIFAVVDVPVVRSVLHSGDVISLGDIDYTSIRTADLSPNVVTDAHKLVGMSPRRSVSPMKPITTVDIVLPVIIKKGDLVTMVLKSPTMTLTTQGKALENAADGESLRVINISSNQTLDAVVTGPKTVAVNAPAEMSLLN
ncbi:MAG: flagellar basal body P-ring formation chaperone FlgA [Micavibrio sp.]|nr:flagellar basal body P-ring formation chaperone FlgA [Micavibrio sp.]